MTSCHPDNDKTSSTTLKRHLKKYADVLVNCPECRETMTCRDFYSRHATSSSSERHELNSKRQCVFCFGRYEWGRGEKFQRCNVKHVEQCLKRFVDENSVSFFREEEEEKQKNHDDDDDNDDSIVCPCSNFVSRPRQMNGRIKDRRSELVGFYDSVFEKSTMWETGEGVHFDERSGLGKDVFGIIMRFLFQDLIWIHVMVKHNAFDTFVKELFPIRNQFVVLPFWCLCDGLVGEDGIRKCTHRHMIIAYEPESEFESIWKNKIRYPLPSKKNKKGLRSEMAKKVVAIKNVFHLIRTIVYVSTPKASCDRRGKDVQSHFYINRPMSEHAIAFLSLLVPGGIEQLLVEQLGRKHVVDWVDDAVLVRRDSNRAKWAVPIGKTGWKFEKCVIPLDRKYVPTLDDEFCSSTVASLTWCGDKKLYLKVNADLENWSRDDWYAYQVRCGNTFRSLRNEKYVLTRPQQNAMNQIKQALEKMKKRIDLEWREKLLDSVCEREKQRIVDDETEKEVVVRPHKQCVIYTGIVLEMPNEMEKNGLKWTAVVEKKESCVKIILKNETEVPVTLRDNGKKKLIRGTG